MSNRRPTPSCSRCGSRALRNAAKPNCQAHLVVTRSQVFGQPKNQHSGDWLLLLTVLAMTSRAVSVMDTCRLYPAVLLL